jgi:hypothetical protein
MSRYGKKGGPHLTDLLMPADGLTRHVSHAATEPTPRHKAALSRNHEAVVKGHTVFTSRVFDADQRDRVLISGINNAKIGKRVTKGPWAGFPIYLLTLEERATCPRSCAVWRECYGSALPMAVRFRYTPSLIARLDGELAELDRKYPVGFVVRLHVLGDFPDIDYLRDWAEWSDRFEALHVWGYTAHPVDSEIGSKIALMNELRPERWQVRFSVAPGVDHAPMQAAAIWFKPEQVGPGMVICPQELGKTRTCGTCSLCWNPNAAGLRILFLGHGKNGGRTRSESAPAEIRPVTWRPEPVAPFPGPDLIQEFIARNGVVQVPEVRP